MKKVLLVATGLLIFGCESTDRNTTNSEDATGVENTTSEDNSTESVQEGAGSEISPQLEGIEDSAARLKVDPINSTQETQEKK